MVKKAGNNTPKHQTRALKHKIQALATPKIKFNTRFAKNEPKLILFRNNKTVPLCPLFFKNKA
ncbi:hypothetical protein C7N43_04140 [Sphingobacteriales bacterium UPWRP_1]|nr:hypothetical protein B6N25_05775 [Sphingobacteriales bacterium TSM_CSS]PSJ78395.1 hypothetical protein C7N43_04140 [Sphingobacteriales bacterium UPWRP_1]